MLSNDVCGKYQMQLFVGTGSWPKNYVRENTLYMSVDVDVADHIARDVTVLCNQEQFTETCTYTYMHIRTRP